MNKSVVIHIGQSKTGTTAIQRFFWANRVPLMNFGVHYVQTGVTHLNSPAQYGLFTSPSKRTAKVQEAWTQAIAEIEQSASPTCLISCENAWLLGDRDVQAVREFLADYPTCIVMFLRSPRSYFASSYKQAIKVGSYIGSFEGFVSERAPRVQYRELIDRWSKTYGREYVGAFSYESHREHLLETFLWILGLDLCQLRSNVLPGTRSDPANVTPSDNVLGAIRLVHRFADHMPLAGTRVKRALNRRLLAGESAWLGDLLSRLPISLLTDRDSEVLKLLPEEHGVEFDDIQSFRYQIMRLKCPEPPLAPAKCP